MSSKTAFYVAPGKGLGFFILGASLHSVVSHLKAQPHAYPQLDLAYSVSEPVLAPVLLTLPQNGLRLRFDGPDQRLRLIEVLDFSKISLTYKSNELVRRSKPSNEGHVDQEVQVSGPLFRHIYIRLFGPSYPGEYVPPTASSSSDTGAYILSYPGVAFSFPLKHSAWSERSDFVALLSSSAASPATSMAIFMGTSWSEARSSIFTRTSPYPRSIALSGRDKEFVPDEIEAWNIYGAGRLEVLRRTPSPPFSITLGETTPQDLVTELGPPDAIFRKSDTRIAIHGTDTADLRSSVRASTAGLNRTRSQETKSISAPSYTVEADTDIVSSQSGDRSAINPECFYNYFHHGFDALISFPTSTSPAFPRTQGVHQHEHQQTDANPSNLVVTKIILHANIPGSYPFNRHRRSRWSIITPPPPTRTATETPPLTSELPFSEISQHLRAVWSGSYASADEERSAQRGMVLNRGWGESPDSSIELLGGFEDSTTARNDVSTAAMATAKMPSAAAVGGAVDEGLQGLGNTQLFGFPGLLFEVLKCGAVSCLTVY